jgi:hypothetical protein
VPSSHDVVVELYYSAAWHTVPVYTRNTITITRGRPDEAGQLTPATATATLDNRTQAYDPRNPASALFGLIGRNTPARITVDGTVRITGEVSSWKPGRSLDYRQGTGRGDAWMDIVISGGLRRWSTGDPLESAARRAVLAVPPIAYWPLEDAEAATAGQSLIPGVPDLSARRSSAYVDPVTGKRLPPPGMPKFAATDGPAGGGPAMSLAEGGTLQAQIPVRSAEQSWEIQFAVRFTPGVFDGETIFSNTLQWETEFDPVHWGITFSDGAVSVSADVAPFFLTAARDLDDGVWHHIAIYGVQVAGDVQAFLVIDNATVGFEAFPGFIGQPRNILINTAEAIDPKLPDGFGHLAVYAPWIDLTTAAHLVSSYHGHTGETAGERIERLCTEQGITLTSDGDLADTVPMGRQRPITLTALLAECEQVDGGILTEPAGSIGLHYRPRTDLYNQTPALTLDYDSFHFAPGLEPVVDDLDVANDVTAKDLDGATARVVRETGPLNVGEPGTAAGAIGRSPITAETNAATPAQLPDLAAWRLALGTVDETRWPQVTVDLDATPSLVTDVEALDPGDVVEMTGLQADPALLLVGQIAETVSPARRLVTLTGVPASPYTVGEVEDAILGRADTDGSELAADVDAGVDTTMTVDITAGPLWITTAGQAAMFPLDVRAGGVRLTVTGISGASSPQTFTIDATPVNGVIKTIPAGTPVSLWTPWRAAL